MTALSFSLSNTLPLTVISPLDSSFLVSVSALKLNGFTSMGVTRKVLIFPSLARMPSNIIVCSLGV